jgi:hypothetical protein
VGLDTRTATLPAELDDNGDAVIFPVEESL